MNIFKDPNEGEKQPILINIECCQNCALHQWFTHHSEEKYDLYFNEMKLFIEREIDHVRVEKNMIPNNLVKLESKFQQDDQSSYLDLLQNKPVQYPRIGSFEISIFNITIFSKITSQAWPHYNSVISILKNIITEKSQNKVVVHYSVLKSDQNDSQDSLQAVSYRVPIMFTAGNGGRKSGSSSPKPHNGIKVPPIQNFSAVARSNSPRLRNFLSPIEPRNVSEETQKQQQATNIQLQREKAQSPQKTLPPLNDNKVNQKEQAIQQQSHQLKTNFYQPLNQDEKLKSSINFNSQKYRGQSPPNNGSLQLRKGQENQTYDMNKSSIEEGNIQDANRKESNQPNQNNSTLLIERKNMDHSISKTANTTKVRFDYSTDNEKLQEKEQQNEISKPVTYLKKIDSNKLENVSQTPKGGIGGAAAGGGQICDMKIKTVKLPYRNVYTNLKKNQSPIRNQNGQGQIQSEQVNQNSSPLLRNRLLTNNKQQINAKQQIQRINTNGVQSAKEEGRQEDVNKQQSNKDSSINKGITTRSPILKFNKTPSQSNKSSTSSQNISAEQKRTDELQGKSPKENRPSLFLKENNKKLAQETVQDSNGKNQKSEQIDLKSLYKKVSQDKDEKANEQNDFLKTIKNNQFESQKQTIHNLSNIELIKNDDVQSSSSLFSAKDKKENAEDNDEENIVQSQNILEKNEQQSDQETEQNESKDSIKSNLDLLVIEEFAVQWLNKVEERAISFVLKINSENTYDADLNEEQKINIKQNMNRISENHTFFRYNSMMNEKEPLMDLTIKRKLTSQQS